MLTDVLGRTRSRLASGFQQLSTCLWHLPVKLMKPTRWLTRALNKSLGAYSLSTAEKHTAVLKQRKLTMLVSRGSTTAARMRGLWGKPGVPRPGDAATPGETSSAGQDRETNCTVHLGCSLGLNLGGRSSPLQRCRLLEAALERWRECNARLGHVYVCADSADPDVILQRSLMTAISLQETVSVT